MKDIRKQNPTKPQRLIPGQVYHVYPLNELVEIENVKEVDGILIIEGKWAYDYARRFTFTSKNISFANNILLKGQIFHQIIFPEGMPNKIELEEE